MTNPQWPWLKPYEQVIHSFHGVVQAISFPWLSAETASWRVLVRTTPGDPTTMIEVEASALKPVATCSLCGQPFPANPQYPGDNVCDACANKPLFLRLKKMKEETAE